MLWAMPKPTVIAHRFHVPHISQTASNGKRGLVETLEIPQPAYPEYGLLSNTSQQRVPALKGAAQQARKCRRCVSRVGMKYWYTCWIHRMQALCGT